MLDGLLFWFFETNLASTKLNYSKEENVSWSNQPRAVCVYLFVKFAFFPPINFAF